MVPKVPGAPSGVPDGFKGFQEVSDAPEPQTIGTRVSANGTAPLARLELREAHMERPLVAREHP